MQEAGEFKLLISGKMPENWQDCLPTFTPEDKGLATRLHSQTMLNALSSVLPGVHQLASCAASSGHAFSPALLGSAGAILAAVCCLCSSCWALLQLS